LRLGYVVIATKPAHRSCYYKFTESAGEKNLKLVNIWQSYFVRLGTILLKDEAFVRDLEHGGQQLLLTVVTLISTWSIDIYQTGADHF